MELERDVAALEKKFHDAQAENQFLEQENKKKEK